MSAPKTIRLAGVDYQVSHEPSLARSNPEVIGTHRHSTQSIWVDGTLNEVAQRKTLLHELVHAVSHTHSSGADLSEVQVLAMEHGLYALFRDNPGLADYLFGDVKP